MYAFFLNFQIKISFLLDFLTETQKRLDLPLFSPFVLQSQPVFFTINKSIETFFQIYIELSFCHISTLLCGDFTIGKFQIVRFRNRIIFYQPHIVFTFQLIGISAKGNTEKKIFSCPDCHTMIFSASCCRIAGRSPPPLLLARPHKRLSHNSYSSMVAGDTFMNFLLLAHPAWPCLL